MHSVARIVAAAAMVVCSASQISGGAARGVTVKPNEAQRRADISIDGKPFTSFIWPTTLKKPTLFPLITDDGVTVTRGYPLEPRAGERVDHPMRSSPTIAPKWVMLSLKGFCLRAVDQSAES